MWLQRLISVTSKSVVETTFSAIAACVFQLLPAKDKAGVPTDIFDEALAIVVKVEAFRRKSSQIALYNAAREYFGPVPPVSESRILSGTAMEKANAEAIENQDGQHSIREEVETFSTAVVVKILEEPSIDADNENIRLARIKMVLAFLRQFPSVSSAATIAAREKIGTSLKPWKSAERSRPLQKNIDEALEANQQALERAGRGLPER